jgi:large repetitive protein
LSYYSGTAATGTALSGTPTTVGTYVALASFAGSTDYVSAAASATFSITKATPTITVTDSGGAYTGSPYAATVKVNGGSSLEGVAPTLIYYAGVAATGTALSGVPSTVGTYTVLGSFAGSADYKNSSASITFTISRSATTTTVTSSLNPAVVGQSITLTATVAPASGAGTPTGTVTFYAGSTILGTGTLTLVGGVAQATLTVSSLAVGNYSIKAVYSDDANFAASTSAALAQVISSLTTNAKSNIAKMMSTILADL